MQLLDSRQFGRNCDPDLAAMLMYRPKSRHGPWQELGSVLSPLRFAVPSTVGAGTGNFGDGKDGAAVFDGVNAVTGWTRAGSVYSTTRADWFYTTITISSGVTLCMEVGGEGAGGGCSGRIFSNAGITVVSGTATIKLNGGTPTTATPAPAFTAGHTGAVAGTGAGGIQNAGQNAGNFGGSWFNTFRGGIGGFGGASATNAGSTTAAQASTIFTDLIGSFNTWHQASLGRLNMSNNGILAGGAGGGSGGGTTGVAAGGAGGNGGGVIIVGAKNVTGTLVIQAKGGNGAPGVAAGGSNAGGGSGGGGGIVIFGVGTSSMPAGVTLDASGGTGGAHQGTGNNGGNGGNGSTTFYLLGPV